MSPTIIFLKVTTNQEKLFSLTSIIQKHFDLSDQTLIFTPTDEIARYIDQLIWRLPEESFIPHIISNETCRDRVVITSKKENINKAQVLINLGQDAYAKCQEFQIVYELYDQTHPSKEESSKLRHASYINSGYSVQL